MPFEAESASGRPHGCGLAGGGEACMSGAVRSQPVEVREFERLKELRNWLLKPFRDESKSQHGETFKT